MPAPQTTAAEPPRPWWRHGLVWLVLAGPIAVVLASIVTFVVAARGSDRVVEEDYYRKGMRINERLRERALVPAMQGRNHAATPGAAAQP